MDALNEFVKEQLKITIKEFDSLENLNKEMDAEARNVIASFSCRECVPYENFKVIFHGRVLQSCFF